MEGQPGCGRGAVEQVAAVKGATATQVALAWLLARGPSIVPIFGTRRLDRVKENLGAADVSLSDEDMAGHCQLNDLRSADRVIGRPCWLAATLSIAAIASRRR